MASSNQSPFARVHKPLTVNGKDYSFFSLPELNDPRVATLPYSIRILLESAIRNCDGFQILEKDVEKILNWERICGANEAVEVPFRPARIILQDFTGVPAVVDLAAMRDAVARLGADPSAINPLVPVDLVVDHSVQVDVARSKDAVEFNQAKEFERNQERFKFLKWGSKSFDNLQIIPPGGGIVHQVNLEYLARVVFDGPTGVLYPDSLVGTDSHTTMINGLGVFGWGVGGIEAEAVMLGQAMSMVLPKVVGMKLIGRLPAHVTSTDLVLTITAALRSHGVVEKFVEFYGEGVDALSIADRATISNMAPEYGATLGFFPVDSKTLDYMRVTGRDEHKINVCESYLKAQGLFHTAGERECVFSEHLTLDLSSVVPSLAGPKQPHHRVPVSEVKESFRNALTAKLGPKSFGLSAESAAKRVPFTFDDGKTYELTNGSVVIAAITSCTNTSNPAVLFAAGLLAKKAVEAGLSTLPFIKTSLAPGSGVVTQYLAESGLQPFLDALGFNVVGYGCTTCIGNSGDLPAPITAALEANPDLVAASVLSGNRNFEARVHALAKAAYLASPPLVVAYSLAGRVDIDWETEPIGTGVGGKPVFLRDIWPSAAEINGLVDTHVTAKMFRSVYQHISEGNPKWNALEAPQTITYPWDERSTYIHSPPFFQSMTLELEKKGSITGARALLSLGDGISTDAISPAGNIASKSSAARFLNAKGITAADFNTYGARRGNDEVMVRGTFANTRLANKLLGAGNVGPRTVHIPSKEVLDIYDASDRYKSEGTPLIVLAGSEYGCGSSRDWAAKGPYMLGVKAVIAKSFERIHRSNLVGMGILPLQFKAGQDTESLGLTGFETFDLDVAELVPGQDVRVRADGKEFVATLRLDTAVELTYYRNGGILPYVLRGLVQRSQASGSGSKGKQ